MPTLTLRNRNQLTLRQRDCDELGIAVGDELESHVDEQGRLILQSKKNQGKLALQEIQAVMQSSGISLEDLQQEAQIVREELLTKEYGKKQ
ncbi:MAG: hypothetical protein WCP97_04145 [bacterium]